MKIDDREELALRIIDIWLDYRSRYSNLPGFQVCIRKKNKIILSKAYGYANLNTKRLLTPKDLFHIASHSKTFTSCAVLQLIEQGRLPFHASAIEYLPELKHHKDKRFKQITIRDLLSNRSGIFRNGLESDFWELQKPFLSKDQLLQEVLASNLIFSPNECTKYSNMGYSLLGLIIENVLKMPYAKAMDILVLQKLKETQIFPDYVENRETTFADGHSRPFLENKRLPLKHTAAHAMAPTTGFCANAEDTSLFFDQLLLGKGLLKKEMQQELLSLSWPIKNSTVERYGLGLLTEIFSDREFVGHGGAYPGFSTITGNWVGTDYIMSFFLNTNEQIPLTVVRSFIQIIEKVNATFTNAEAKKAKVCGPFMNKWRSLLFILTPKKGLCFHLENWTPCEDALVLKSKDGEEFLCDGQSGFDEVGEKIIFNKGKEGNVQSVKWASSTYHLEKVFLKDLENTLLFSR